MITDGESVLQKPDQVIDIKNWYIESKNYNEGAREKSLIICPAACKFEFCITNNWYLFKETMKKIKDPKEARYSDQYWAEIVAFYIGRLMNVSVPRTFVAINSETGEPGALIEWFGYDCTSVAGGAYMQQMIPEYDREKGKQHNMLSVIKLCKTLVNSGKLKAGWEIYWACCLCFDALIGNTDRHQENWKILWKKNNNEDLEGQFSPVFDNGTSLGHEIFPAKFHLVNDKTWLKRYINRGTHHMRWDKDDKVKLHFFEGVEKFCTKYPKTIPILIEKLNWKNESLRKILEQCTQFNIRSSLSEERACFIYKLTCKRKQVLIDSLEKLVK